MNFNRINRYPLLTAFVITFAAAIASAAEPATKPAPPDRAAIDTAVGEMAKMIGDGRIDQMLDRIGPIPEDQREDYERMRERLININGYAGKYSGFDIAGVKQLTPRYQVEYVVVYFEKHPVLFEVGFYFVGGKWRAQNLTIDHGFKELLDTMPLQK